MSKNPPNIPHFKILHLILFTFVNTVQKQQGWGCRPFFTNKYAVYL